MRPSLTISVPGTTLAEHFSQEEILEIIGIVINMNVWTRLKMAEGAGLAKQATS
ncbi:hypothetical protein [Micromonospora sp. NPDC005367]|uniref:hypothetical protein n=1 Tax=Micromonospora sp. NPDC005367 TaxID=3155590 RepID=UPI0033B7A7CD